MRQKIIIPRPEVCDYKQQCPKEKYGPLIGNNAMLPPLKCSTVT